MFVDSVKVYARAGHGGKGCIAFLREAFRPKGGPSGGNGGRGGHVILEADHDINNLIAQFYQGRLIARNGLEGKGKGMDGQAGNDLLIKVPCGTTVWRIPPPKSAPKSADTEDSDEPEKANQADGATERPSQEKELVTDLTQDGERFVLAAGGRGGLGNSNFATARRQAPRFAQPGEPGQEGHYLLELRLMAEVGLVGFPNAGKSTLLTAISRARPKIAPYPFTTLHPQIGIVEYQDFHRLTVCDVPGLIEGAHLNVGLGHAFLRHIQRCRILAVVIDMAGSDDRKPWDDYDQIRDELRLYDPSLAAKPFFVAANKMDEEAARENIGEFTRRRPNVEVLPIAAAFDEGIPGFKDRIRSTSESALPVDPSA